MMLFHFPATLECSAVLSFAELCNTHTHTQTKRTLSLCDGSGIFKIILRFFSVGGLCRSVDGLLSLNSAASSESCTHLRCWTARVGQSELWVNMWDTSPIEATRSMHESWQPSSCARLMIPFFSRLSSLGRIIRRCCVTSVQSSVSFRGSFFSTVVQLDRRATHTVARNTKF